jgi:hypothetical protein
VHRSIPSWTFIGALALAACANPEEPDDMRSDAGVRDAGTERDAGEEETPRDGGPRDGGDVTRDGGPRDGGAERDGGPDRDGGPRVVDIVVAYTAGADAPLLADLFLTESSTTRYRVTPQLAGGPTTGGKGEPVFAGVDSFEWTRDGEIIYVAQQETFDLYEIFLAPQPGNPITTKLSNPGMDRQARSYALSPSGTMMTFGQAVEGEAGTRRFVVPVAVGAQPIRLSMGTSSFPFWRGDDGIAYQDIIVSANDRDLWFSDLTMDPPPRTRLHSGANLGFTGTSASFSADGQYIVFSADDGALRVFQPYRVTFTGNTPSAPEPVYANYPSTADIIGIDTIKFAPTGTMVAFMGDIDTDGTDELYVFDASATLPLTPTRLTTDFPAGHNGVDRFQWNAAGTHILFAADYDVDGRYDLYLTDINGANGVRINTPVTASDTVDHERLIHGEDRILYTRYDGNERRVKLVDISTTPFGAPVDLGPGSRFSFDTPYELSPSEDWMIHATSDDPPRLYLTDLRAQTPTTSTVLSSIGDLGFDSYGKWCWAQDDRLLIVRTDGQLGLVEDFTSSDTFVVSGPLADGSRVTACAFPPNIQK